MRSQAMFFQEQAAHKACDPQMQKTLAYVRPLFVGKRKKGLEGLAADGLGFEEMRVACQEIRDRVVDNLDVWLELFEARAQATGAEVLWARDGDEVARLLVDPLLAEKGLVPKGVRNATEAVIGFVEKQIIETEPGFKGDTATGGTKPATLETGLVIQVPLFIEEGAKVRVNTDSGSYIERVQ